jgi:hypothetical protein
MKTSFRKLKMQKQRMKKALKLSHEGFFRKIAKDKRTDMT